MKTWAESWGDADRTCGFDLPPIHSLPHMSERAAAFAASVQGPQGELPKIEKSLIRRALSFLRRDNGDEVEKLRRMLAEVNAE